MLWFILGIVLGAGAWWLAKFLQARNIKLKVYEWGLLASATILLLVGLQNLLALSAEFDVRAGWATFALFAVPALVLTALVAGLTFKRQSEKIVPGKAS